jgi:prophage regulatory protein
MNRIVREREVRALTGLSRTSRWRMEKIGQFPLRRRLGKQAVGWLVSDIDAWLASRPRGPQPARQDAP